MIEIDQLCKHYRTADGCVTEVLKAINLQVPQANITAVVGPSGEGKHGEAQTGLASSSG